jgi:hypothetical protein
VRGISPKLVVEIIDLALSPNAGRNMVFAVPTYVYGTSAVFIGNPSEVQLMTWLDKINRDD